MAEEAIPLKNNTIKRVSTLTSRDLRQQCSTEGQNVISTLKIGPVLTLGELSSWTGKLKRLTSVRHKNILLRLAHGDIFSNSRLHKFGLRDSPACANCQEQVENIHHRVRECPKAIEAWTLLNDAKANLGLMPLEDFSIESILGVKDRLSKVELALNAELVRRVTSKSEGYDAGQTVKSVIKLIGNAERLNEDLTNKFKIYLANN